MTITDEDFPAALKSAAEGWTGTPFRKLHASKGVGVDCANVVYACLSDAGLELPDLDAPSFGQSADVNFYGVIEEFLAGLADAGTIEAVDDISCPQIQAGDLLLYRISRRTQHLTLAVTSATQISAWPGRATAIVAFDGMWKRMLKAHYRLATEETDDESEETETEDSGEEESDG